MGAVVRTLAGMVTRRRCAECGRRFEAAVTASKTQKVCGAECRLARRRKQARRRRQDDLDGHREDEAERQRVCRAARRAARGALAAGSAARCHAPASVAKGWKGQDEIDRIVAEAFQRSRAGLERELRRAALKIRPIVVAEAGRGGP